MIIDMSNKTENTENVENEGKDVMDLIKEIEKTIKDMVTTHRTLMGIIKSVKAMMPESDDAATIKVLYEETIKAICKEDENFTNAMDLLGNGLINAEKKV